MAEVKLDRVHTIAAYASFITLGLSFIFLALIFIWAAFPYKTLEIKGIHLVERSVKAGGMLHYTVNYCKYIDAPAETSRAFINGIVFTTPTLITNNPTGCYQNVHRIEVPSELPSGTYKIRSVYTYQVNPIREMSITSVTESFKITGSDVDRQEDQN